MGGLRPVCSPRARSVRDCVGPPAVPTSDAFSRAPLALELLYRRYPSASTSGALSSRCFLCLKVDRIGGPPGASHLFPQLTELMQPAHWLGDHVECSAVLVPGTSGGRGGEPGTSGDIGCIQTALHGSTAIDARDGRAPPLPAGVVDEPLGVRHEPGLQSTHGVGHSYARSSSSSILRSRQKKLAVTIWLTTLSWMISELPGVTTHGPSRQYGSVWAFNRQRM